MNPNASCHAAARVETVTLRRVTQSDSGTMGKGRRSDKLGRKAKSSKRGRYHRTYWPPLSAYQNCTPISTAADRAMTWPRFLGDGQNASRLTSAKKTMNTGMRYAQWMPCQIPSAVGTRHGCQSEELIASA